MARAMNLFNTVAPENKLHPIYRLISMDRYAPERDVLMGWAAGFEDRDNKFPFEFQTTFEPCLWELYIHAFLRQIGANIDFSHQTPDFNAQRHQDFCIEATIAAPAQGGPPAFGHSASDIPDDLNEFNSQATLRICNSFVSKERKYQQQYSKLPHVQRKPFIIAIASFDRPFSHLAASRPIMSALYGLYHDEEMTIANGSENVESYNVQAVIKNKDTEISLGYFADDTYKHVSAVIYSSLATWGKVRALAVNPDANSIYTTFHPQEGSLYPLVRRTPKRDYVEDLTDGLYVFHNPFAEYPLDLATLNHERVAQFFVQPDGELEVIAPDDFLLVRFIETETPAPK